MIALRNHPFKTVVSSLSQQAQQVSNSVWWLGVLLALITATLLPHTVFSAPLEKLQMAFLAWLGWYDISGGLTTEGAVLAYLAGYCLLVGCLLAYLYLRLTHQVFSAPTAAFTDAVSLFVSLYLLDFFFSTLDPFPFQKSLWVFTTFIAFYTVLLFVDDRQKGLWLVKGIIIAITVQCLYAVAYYALDIRQFHTPHFGNRTGGTFGNVNVLYPLTLIGCPLSLVLAQTATRKVWRWFWMGSSSVIGLALVFTYTRAGWLAFAVSVAYLACSPASPFARHRVWRGALGLLVGAALLGTALVRTQGKLVGHPEDRSFWGRFAIWQTAIKAVADHPFLGSGLNAYAYKQREHMTPQLARFNPTNVEAKNLLLTIAVEFGLIGLGLFCFLVWRYVRLYRCVLQVLSASDEIRAITVGIHAALLGIFIAGLFDTPLLHEIRFPVSLTVAFLLGILCNWVNQGSFALASSEEDTRKLNRWWKRCIALTLLTLSPIAAYLLGSVVVGIKWARDVLPQVHALTRHYPPDIVPFVPLNAISEDMRYAVVAAEDGYFFFHRGVDWLALHRALRRNIRALRFKEGGSTITMQVARCLFLSREKVLPRKIAEIVLAKEIERCLPKERILELYLNTARFGMWQDGILAAARNYFGKHPKDLTLAEAAFLAGVLPEPPFDRRRLTPAFVWRCQRRTLERLSLFFPQRYPLQVLCAVQKTALRFRWGQQVVPSVGGMTRCEAVRVPLP